MKRLFSFLILCFTICLSLNGVSGFAAEKPFEGEQVKIGVVGDEYAEIWEYVAEKAFEEEGIELEVVLLTDYVLPNQALMDGSIDMNAFQHDVFMNNWNNENDGDIVAIAYTVAVPTRIYSEKYQSLDELPQGAKIAMNNVPASLSNSLITLSEEGLFTLPDDEDRLFTPKDIVDNPKDIEIVELDPSYIPSAVSDVDAAFIDDSFLASTNFEPKDAIYVYGDTPETLRMPYVNNIAVREENKDNPLYQKIVELYQTDDVADKINEVTKGGSIPAWDLVAESKELNQ